MNRKLCAILCAALLAGVVVPTASAATFTDTTGHWAAAQIENCAGRGIVDGVGCGRFDPEGKVTNAQFVKMLCSAFFVAEEQTFENENRAAIDDYFGGSVQWYAYKSYYFQKLGLLNDVDYNIQSATSANQPMNRNNMAQVAANVLIQKGITANEQDRAVAQVTMPDYHNVPEVNRSAVKTCYALGVIKGTDGGKFDGTATMTRAQACTVITRMLDVVHKGHTDPDPTPSQPDEPTLANGQPITEENVKAMLAQLETEWPAGTLWGDGTATNDNYYKDKPGYIMFQLLERDHFTNATYGCGGYAAMISDKIFGKTTNPTKRITDISNIRPGDIVVWQDASGTTIHVILVTDVATSGNRTGWVYYTDAGGANGTVHWPESKWDNKEPNANGRTWVAYTRYPD